MQNRHEKILYENDKGQRVEIAYSFPFFFQQLIGADGTNAEISKTNGVGQDGTTIEDVSLSDRPLQILGVIKGYSKEEIAKYRAKLLQVFNPKVKGWLQYEYGDIKRKIRCQVENAPKFTKKFSGYKYQDFLINLVCPNPYWQDLNKVKIGIAYWRGTLEFPLELIDAGVELGIREPSLIVNVDNPGDIECGMTLEFKAISTVINPIIINVNTQEFIKLNRTMEAGEVITVTTHFGNKRVESKLNGIAINAFNYLDLESTFIQLDVGDNLFRYDAAENINNLEVNIYYSPQYLGV